MEMIPMRKLTRSRAIVLATLIMAVVALAFFGSTLLSFDRGAVSSAAPAQNIIEPADSAIATQALNQLLATNGQIDAHVSRKTGVYTLVRARSGVLAASSVLLTPEARARAFLSTHGGVLGMTDAERALAAAPGPTSPAQLVRVVTDPVGGTHVKFDQRYQGLKVYGAQVVVHMNSTGITAVNGDYVPAVNVSTAPKVTAARAAEVALKQQIGDTPYTVVRSELLIYRTGLLEGFRGQSRLAHAVEVTNGKAIRDLIVIDATKGKILNQIALNPDGLNRIIYTPEMDDAFAVRHEGDPDNPGPTPGTTGADPINNLYVMAGHTYNLFSSAFGRDSFDGLGGTMHSVYLINDICPNAYWNGISTNYCPDFDADDVVSHEWAHGYTQHTHNLVYSYQSGALNESYSDIFGETMDLLNGVDAEGGSNNTQPMPNGQRWQMGEDVNVFNQPAAGILRDMWTPTRYNDPDRVGASQYACGSGDGGGVHTNSGVPNHAFAMLVDGKTFNGQTVQPIGFTRAAAIYYRAMTVYQTSSSDFPFHALALHASCNDLIGQPLKNLSTSSATGTTSTETITATHCQQVDKAMLAVEMSEPPPCPVIIILDPDEPEACESATDIFAENWESGDDGWTRTSTGVTADWTMDDGVAPGGDQARLRNFNLTTAIPGGGGSGSAMYAANPAIGSDGGGTCTPGGDYSGQFTITSPTITIPADGENLELRFDHYIATETGYDGTQVEISVNGGAFQLVPKGDYVFNGPNGSLSSVIDGNTNPNAGEAAWTGTNVGQPSGSPPGSWGTTIINLSNLTNPGQTVAVRFNASQDGCNGVDGWYIDNIRVYFCAVLPPPTLSLGADYENPDTNGSYTLNWTRPGTATGPDVLQESSICAPLLNEDASSLDGWTATQAGAAPAPMWQVAVAGQKPQHNSESFWANPVSEQGTQSKSAILTYNDPISIPSSGITTLSFSEWYFNEDDDRGFVEISTDNGVNWTAIYTNARSMGDLPDTGVDAFANEGLTRQTLNLTPYSGQNIRLRFRYALGVSNFFFFIQYGWYIDDIVIESNSWVDLVNADVTSFLVSGRSNGTRCYRARTAYPGGIPSPYSNQVSATTELVACTIENVALATAGAIASATSSHSSGLYPASGAINGNHIGNDWNSGGGWNDGTRATWPDTLEVNFGQSRTIDEIRVYTLQNNWQNGVEPTETTSASGEGILDFTVEYWDGAAWVNLASVTGNDKAMRVFQFPQLTTTKIRVVVTAARNNWSRIVEVEAFGCN
jgi:bacillolysin